MKLNRTASALIAGSAALTLVLAGCSSDDSTAADSSSQTTAAASESSSATESTDAAVTLTDAYIKAKTADKKMTAIFGVLSNNTDKDLKVSSFKVEGLKEGTKFQQHETKDGKMSEAPEGLTIPANGKLSLQPGGTHFMIMDNDEAMEPGAQYTLVVELSDGSSLTEEIEVRVQPSGEENYGSDGSLQSPGSVSGASTGSSDSGNAGGEQTGHSSH